MAEDNDTQPHLTLPRRWALSGIVGLVGLLAPFVIWIVTHNQSQDEILVRFEQRLDMGQRAREDLATQVREVVKSRDELSKDVTRLQVQTQSLLELTRETNLLVRDLLRPPGRRSELHTR